MHVPRKEPFSLNSAEPKSEIRNPKSEVHSEPQRQHLDKLSLNLSGKESSPLNSAEPKSEIRNPKSEINMGARSEAKANDSPTDKAAPQEYVAYASKSDRSMGRAVPMDSSRRPDQRSGMEKNRSELPKPPAVLSEPPVHEEVRLPSLPKGSYEIHRDRPEVVDQIVRHVVTSIKEGRSEMHILLEPEHLGTLRLRLLLDESTLTVRLQVASESTRELIESHLPKLRAFLEQQGLSVEKFDVLVEHEAPGSSDRRETPLYRERTSAPYSRGPENGLVTLEEADVLPHRLHRSFGYNTMEWTA